MSVNFLFVLVGTAQLSAGETRLMSVVAVDGAVLLQNQGEGFRTAGTGGIQCEQCGDRGPGRYSNL